MGTINDDKLTITMATKTELENFQNLRGKRASPFTSYAISAVTKYIRDNYDFGNETPSVEKFCQYIIDEHVDTQMGERFVMGTPFDIPELMFTSGNYCIAAQKLGLVTDEKMNEYANTRGGSWIYIDSYKWNDREPSFMEMYSSDYITFRQMLDTLKLIETINTMVSERNM
jgi:hypothetical protein